MKIQEIQEEIVEEFAAFDDWMDKYAYLIELGGDLEPMPESFQKDENIIKGCQSRVWLHAEYNDGLMKYYAFSDAVIVKGIVALLLRVFSEQPPKDILEAKTDFISEIGLDEHLSPTRSNGLAAMVKQIKIYALAYSKA
ncbi:cysteine desulfuration protein SufE [Balneicella halophila]|uniref:Cysteine desulfuration protein SufE n=1 Tax=Balneicella halophila TaxID=1537566 RepID=A0A7L4USE5_BALHA|nr:SufE family protein [Balneicella halophila]PVX51894.1 cysteine desulfuration protein SufE [Balneicella halophila]